MASAAADLRDGTSNGTYGTHETNGKCPGRSFRGRGTRCQSWRCLFDFCLAAPSRRRSMNEVIQPADRVPRPPKKRPGHFACEWTRFVEQPFDARTDVSWLHRTAHAGTCLLTDL